MDSRVSTKGDIKRLPCEMMLEMKHVIAVVGLAVVYHRHKGVQGEARLRQKS